MAADRLVGRHPELESLRRILTGVRAGSGRLALICGPAGIGKTRLVEELVTGGGDIPVGWGAALADAGMPPLWPWTRAVRGFPGPRAAMVTIGVGGAHGEFGSAEDAAAATFAADTAVLDALEEHATGSGMLLVLEDLQWADGATLRLLERLAAVVRRLPLMVVATHRDPGHHALVGLLAHAGTDVLRLRPLTIEESEVLLAASVGDVDKAAVRLAAARSGGSPLYLRTLAQVAGNQLRGAAAGTDITEAPEFRHLVAAAMRVAGPQAAAAAEVASVLGADVPAELLAQLLGLDSADDAIAVLGPAVPAGILEISRTSVRFAHALVRDAAYACLAAPRRAELHRRVAEVLEPLAVGHDDRAGAVAEHWDKAGQPARAAEWAIRAADAARAVGAHDEAGTYLALALDAAHPDAELDRAELLLDLARSQYLGGHLEPSLVTCERAADEGERTDRPDVIAKAAIIIQGVGHPTINQRLIRLCKRALDAPAARIPAHLRARAEAQLACALFETGHHDEGNRWSAAALGHATSAGDLHAELDAIRAHATLTWLPGFDHEMIELGGRAIELAGPTGRPLARLWAHIWRSDAAVHLGNLADALHELGEMKALADQTGLPLVRWHWLRRTAALAALTGDFAGCRRSAADAATVAESWHDESVRGTHLGMMGSLALLRGDPADLPADWEEIAIDASNLLPVGRAVIAAAHMLVGRLDEATAIYQPLIRGIATLKGLNLAALAYLVEVAPSIGDVTGCQVLRSVIAETFTNTATAGAGTVFYMGAVARMLGELDLECGDYEAAKTHLEAGLAVDSMLGARPYVARGRYALARALQATGDIARSLELTHACLADVRRLDMPGLQRNAESLLARLDVAAHSRDPFTAREYEVAQLVAEALSNREVAARLVLSERTIESHVRSILAKTGLRSRTELTRWFLDRRLT